MAPLVLPFRPGVTLPRRAYLDVNLLIHARDQSSPRHQSASLCVRELILQGIELNVSALVFDELWWGFFRLSYRRLTARELNGREYKHNIEIWKADWPLIRRITDEILGWGRLNVLEAAPSVELVRDAMALIDKNPLAPRDAFHLAIVLRHRVAGFVTSDRDFDGVELPDGTGLTIVKI